MCSVYICFHCVLIGFSVILLWWMHPKRLSLWGSYTPVLLPNTNTSFFIFMVGDHVAFDSTGEPGCGCLKLSLQFCNVLHLRETIGILVKVSSHCSGEVRISVLHNPRPDASFTILSTKLCVLTVFWDAGLWVCTRSDTCVLSLLVSVLALGSHLISKFILKVCHLSCELLLGFCSLGGGLHAEGWRERKAEGIGGDNQGGGRKGRMS